MASISMVFVQYADPSPGMWSRQGGNATLESVFEAFVVQDNCVLVIMFDDDTEVWVVKDNWDGPGEVSSWEFFELIRDRQSKNG